ncbi:hypothetical protein PGT21_004620 [Puccinia graminis f. sp. tritici]|uniref:Uncharacterized protein n=2 Tax=Puccinia graminis f. sp. tritici TaxID=56615 RepID=E3KZ71_PUCGT|nr:uncharacterized protein PGTG_15745 [Puccinia graminis f. sp. tritici CRL 75-36-700-3]EFP89596.1 hypothetical protein PGTG_15745 [Puccinia graminis f. sp. tritici CRL 75-36-700-3]KAA1074415.1 hypothetical protein PGT21_004620 [Puccinia graminis f. sp. tritici]
MRLFTPRSPFPTSTCISTTYPRFRLNTRFPRLIYLFIFHTTPTASSMQSSLIVSVLIVCSGVIAVPTSRGSDYAVTEPHGDSESYAPTNSYSPPPKSYSPSVEHSSYTQKPSYTNTAVPQYSSGPGQSPRVHAPGPVRFPSGSVGAYPQYGGFGNGGGMLPGFGLGGLGLGANAQVAGGVGGLVEGGTGFGTGIGANALVNVGTGLNAGARVGAGVGGPLVGVGANVNAAVGAGVGGPLVGAGANVHAAAGVAGPTSIAAQATVGAAVSAAPVGVGAAARVGAGVAV